MLRTQPLLDPGAMRADGSTWSAMPEKFPITTSNAGSVESQGTLAITVVSQMLLVVEESVIFKSLMIVAMLSSDTRICCHISLAFVRVLQILKIRKAYLLIRRGYVRPVYG